MGIRDVILEMHVRLYAGFAPDAVARAAVVAEGALKAIAGKPADAKVMLGELIGELHPTLPRALSADANWLNQRRIAAVHFTGQVRAELDDDACRAVDVAARLATHAKLVTADDIAELRRRAELTASEPASSALLRLDRAQHRKTLDDLLALPRRVLVLLVHGEFGQGHDHFADIVAWRLRAGPKGRWRELAVEWPAPSPSHGTRSAMLYENLAAALGVPLAAPDIDPTSEDGERAWASALAPVIAALAGARDRLYVRHVLRWIGDGDDVLVAAYVRIVWHALAERRGERVVASFDVRRLERAGMPLMKAWRASRTEQRVAAAIARELEQVELPHDGHCAALPELDSVGVRDLADWLRVEARRKRADADAEAAQLVDTTRNGRFDLVVERLAAFNVGRREGS